MDKRQQKGLVIAATSKIQKRGDTWVVPSQSLNGKYTVRMDTAGPRCTCPDFELRQQSCKHVFAVEFVLQRETVTDPDGTTIVTETAAVRVTYTQDWPAYNAAQTTEKAQFCRLLRELVAGIPTPYPKTGRPPLPLSDRLFAAAFKVYSTVSARRFMTDLREAQADGLIEHTPHFNSVLAVIESEDVTPILHELITATSLPLREVETDFAVDSTGFGTGSFFRYYTAKYKHDQYNHDWLKCHAMVGVKTNIVTAVRITGRDDNDSPQFKPLVEQTAERFTISEVSADKAYSSYANLELVESKGAVPFIPFKSYAVGHSKNSTWNRLFHYFALNREEFGEHYHKRSNIETTFSMVKRVFGGSVRSKTPTAQENEVLLKVICHNIRCLIHAIHELGIEPMFPQIGGMAARLSA